RQIADGTVHAQNASGQFAARHALAIANVHLERSKTVAAIGHSGRGNSIRDEYRLLRAFGLSKELHDGGIKMNAVGDDVRAYTAIRKHRAQNAGTAMIRSHLTQRVMTERTHGIEGVCSVPRSRRDSAFGRLKIGVGMSQADANAAPRRFGNDLGRALQFWSNRHHANPAARRLREPLEQAKRRSQQIFQRMHPATRMTEEWPLKMDPQRASSTLTIFIVAFARFDRIRQPLKCTQSCIHWSGDSGRKITRDSMPRQQSLDCRQRLGGSVHDVIAGAAVNVKVNVTRRNHKIAEIAHSNSGGNLPAAPGGNVEDASLVDEHDRTLDGRSRSQQLSSTKSQHRNVLIAAEKGSDQDCNSLCVLAGKATGQS